jgi:hypothetical protein
MIIDYHNIDRSQFSVRDRDGLILITPHKFKHIWEPHEVHLRSLLLDSNGKVISSGFPKFRNMGECSHDDAAFLSSLRTGRVVFTEKRDVTLVCLDMFPSVDAMMMVFPDELGPKSFDRSTLMVRVLPSTVISQFFAIVPDSLVYEGKGGADHSTGPD